jgi:hypothetical protein
MRLGNHRCPASDQEGVSTVSDRAAAVRISPENFEAAMSQIRVDKLKRLWGGRLPTWEEFKQARKEGRVGTDEAVANRALGLLPRAWYIIYGILTPWGMFVVPILAITLYLLGHMNGWIALGSLSVAWFLYKTTFLGACYGILNGATADERLYRMLVEHGAFVFAPTSQEKN